MTYMKGSGPSSREFNSSSRTIDQCFVDHFRTNPGKCSLAEPERLLMYAVLRDGLKKIFSRSAKVRDQAYQWLMSDDEEWLYSFMNACSLLGIEPTSIRKAILQIREEGSSPKRTHRSH